MLRLRGEDRCALLTASLSMTISWPFRSASPSRDGRGGHPHMSSFAAVPTWVVYISLFAAEEADS